MCRALGVVTAFAIAAFLTTPAEAQDIHDRHATGPLASLSVTFRNGLLSVQAVGVERGHVLSGIARQVSIRIRADETALDERVATSLQNVPAEIGIRRLVPFSFDLILMYAAASGADRDGGLTEVWLIPRRGPQGAWSWCENARQPDRPGTSRGASRG